MFHRRPPKAMLAVATVSMAAVSIGLTPGVSHASTQAALSSPSSSSSSDFTLYTEPTAGFTWLYDQINDAQSSIDMTMYELSDTTAEEDLVAAEARGVDVRVILDEKEKSTNDAAYDYLTDNGVSVVWSWTKYYYTHEKSIVFDGTTADIMTLNLTSEYYSTSRDFAVVDTDAADVAADVKVFNADYEHDSVTPGAGDDLVWSPTTAEADITGIINDAEYSLQIFSEEMDDTTIVDDLCDAAENGVDVQVVGENEDGEYDSEYKTLYDCGVQISYYSSSTGFYIHGKSILADYGESTAKIFIGSENFSNTSLTENRELGLIINDAAIESSVNTTFASDFAGGTLYS
jgi:cardiolipin synthase A/B